MDPNELRMRVLLQQQQRQQAAAASAAAALGGVGSFGGIGTFTIQDRITPPPLGEQQRQQEQPSSSAMSSSELSAFPQVNVPQHLLDLHQSQNQNMGGGAASYQSYRHGGGQEEMMQPNQVLSQQNIFSGTGPGAGGHTTCSMLGAHPTLRTVALQRQQQQQRQAQRQQQYQATADQIVAQLQAQAQARARAQHQAALQLALQQNQQAQAQLEIQSRFLENSGAASHDDAANQFLRQLQQQQQGQGNANGTDPLVPFGDLQHHQQQSSSADMYNQQPSAPRDVTQADNIPPAGNNINYINAVNGNGVDDHLTSLQSNPSQLAQLQRLQQTALADQVPSPPSHLPAAKEPSGSEACEAMRVKVRRYEEAARTMMLHQRKQNSKRKLGESDGNRAAATEPAVAAAASSSAVERRASVVSDSSSSSSVGAPATNKRRKKRKAADVSWRDGMKDDADVKLCREKTRRKIEHYVANCMLSEKTSTVANAPFRRVLALKLEEKLYTAAPTFEQYSDSTTLEARLKILAMQIGKRIEANATTARTEPNAKRQRSLPGAAAVQRAAVPPEEHAKTRREALQELVGNSKYDEMIGLVEEIRAIRRTSDVWMSSDSANRRPGTSCAVRKRLPSFPKAGSGDPEEESKENSDAGHSVAIRIVRPGSPEELTAVEAMPRDLTAIYFGTRLVDAVAALGPSHGGSSPQLERRVHSVKWDELLDEARRNLTAFRALEQSMSPGASTEAEKLKSRRASFVEVCTLSGGCRQEPKP